MKFEVIDIKPDHNRFTVEIEISDTRERKFFGYPNGEGWDLDINGERKFMMDIKRKLEDRYLAEDNAPNINTLKQELIGKKIKVTASAKPNKKLEDPKALAKG